MRDHPHEPFHVDEERALPVDYKIEEGLLREAIVRTVGCTYCGAKPGEECRYSRGVCKPHEDREFDYRHSPLQKRKDEQYAGKREITICQHCNGTEEDDAGLPCLFCT